MINQTREPQTAQREAFPRTLSLAVHELRTPLTVVAGFLRMLIREQGGPITDKQRKMLDEAERSCSRLSALVSEMSELGKLEGHELALARTRFDVAALAAEVAANAPPNDRGVEILLSGTDRQLQIVGDRPRLAAVLGSLLQSAVRERGTPGVLVMACEMVERWAVIAIGDASQVPGLTRTARGTPPSFDEWRGGTGLALPIARRVVDAHGGTLWSSTDASANAASALRLPLVS